MLDLGKLEKKLDDALAQETSQSLAKWLFKKRMNSVVESLGAGEFISGYFKVSQDVLIASENYFMQSEYQKISTTQNIKVAA